MSTHLHFDCFNGVSGDMTLGALVDLGVDPDDLQRRLSGLPIGEFSLKAEKVKRAGIVGTHIHVEVEEDPHGHAHLGHIIDKVKAAKLSDLATERAIAAYRALAEAEAHVHGSTPEKIHFHEVGAKDAIVDIAGAMVGVEMLGARTFSASTIALGNGTVKCAHGVMPIPAPATAELLKGMATTPTDIQGELTTPTGAAILRVLVGDNARARAVSKPTAYGYGAGTRRIEGHTNYLRLVLGELGTGNSALPVQSETIISLETEIDDMSPEVSGYLMDKLLGAGARDVQFSSVQMKKNRPGLHLRVLCHDDRRDALAEIILRETSTFGLRVVESERYCLERRMEEVPTPLGPIAVKVGLWGDKTLKVSPEYEACRAAAESSGRPLLEVYALARVAITKRYFPDLSSG